MKLMNIIVHSAFLIIAHVEAHINLTLVNQLTGKGRTSQPSENFEFPQYLVTVKYGLEILGMGVATRRGTYIVHSAVSLDHIQLEFQHVDQFGNWDKAEHIMTEELFSLYQTVRPQSDTNILPFAYMFHNDPASLRGKILLSIPQAYYVQGLEDTGIIQINTHIREMKVESTKEAILFTKQVKGTAIESIGDVLALGDLVYGMLVQTRNSENYTQYLSFICVRNIITEINTAKLDSSRTF